MSMNFPAITAACVNSDLVEPRSIHPRPEEYFWDLPIHVSHHDETYQKACADFLLKWTEALNADGLGVKGFEFHGSANNLCNFNSSAFPETIPERLVLLTEVSDFGFFWDDITDALSPEQSKEITQDLAVVLLAELKLGQRLEPKLEISKLVIRMLREILDQDRELGLRMVDGWKGHLEGTSKSTHNDMSFEEYKWHRLGEVGAIWGIELGCWGADVRVSQEAKDSVRSWLNPGLLSVMLTNDYYSFNKEVAEHERAGTLDRMQNGVGLLMREYGYSEEEARSIVIQEIKNGEREMMKEYHLWEETEGCKPENYELRRYIAIAFFMIGGSSFWISHSLRYSREDITSTPEQRAALTGKGHGELRILDGYATPKAQPQPRLQQKVVPLFKVEPPTTNGVVSNGTNGVNGVHYSDNANEHGPRKHANGVNGDDSVSVYVNPYFAASSDACDEPFEYVNSLQGKGIRNKFIDAMNSWYQAPPASLQIIKHVIQALHNASLMLDDVEDASALRRGHPATHVLYGASQTINSATAAYVKTVQDILRLPTYDGMADELLNLHNGQALELLWCYHNKCPTVEEYLTMVDNKTGRLFQLMLRLMQAESTLFTFSSSSSVSHLLTLCGRYYQIRDDYLNLTSEEYTTKKGFCEDLDEGKFSLPLIHLLSHTKHPGRIMGALFKRAPGASGVTNEVKTHILQAMEAAGTFDFVRRVLRFIHAELLTVLDEVEGQMGPNNGLKVLVLGMAI
ncbi:isoprenoid synthase domain-containing protein [Aspergillus oleicola]